MYENNVNPKIELNFNSDFELLISVLLSAKSTDISVNKATKKLYQIANSPEKILSLGIQKLKIFIKNIGLYNNKAENIMKICKILIKKHNSVIPENRELLEELPGIGRKSANIILNVIFKWLTIGVDTHVFRVSNRTKFALGKNVKIVEKKLLNCVPNKYKLNFHHLFVLHGRYICIARRPKCNICNIYDLCEFKNKTL